MNDEFSERVIDVQRILCQTNCDGVPANCNDCLFHGCCGYTEMALAVVHSYDLKKKERTR